MIKPITTSPFVKRAVIGTMMAGMAATGSFAANNKSYSDSSLPTYTEVSSAASSASRAMAAPAVTSSGNVRNKNLDKRIRDLSENAQELKDNNAYLDTQYQKYGLYGASIDIQFLYDDLMIGQAVTKFQKETSMKIAEQMMDLDAVENLTPEDKIMIALMSGSSSSEPTITMSTLNKAANNLGDNCDALNKYIQNEFAQRRYEFADILGTDALKQGKPTAEKALTSIDTSAKNLLKSQTEQNKFFANVRAFDSAQGGSKTAEKKANLLSYKIFLLDKMVLNNTLKSMSFFKNNKEFNKYLEAEFLSKEPKPIR